MSHAEPPSMDSVMAAWLAPLRAEIAELRAEIAASKASVPPEKVMLSIAAAGRRYGVGRLFIKRLIQAGKLPVVERTCRGGRIGQFAHLTDCERVLARKGSTK